MKKIILCSFMLGLIFLFSGAHAAERSITAVPTGWLLQNYVPDGVVVYYTGSPCVSGLLSFGPNATRDDKNKFWALIMAAKLSGKTVSVWYDDSSAVCIITSFVLNHE